MELAVVEEVPEEILLLLARSPFPEVRLLVGLHPGCTEKVGLIVAADSLAEVRAALLLRGNLTPAVRRIALVAQAFG